MPTKPARIPLYSPLSNRAALLTNDARLYNGYAEKAPGEDEGIWIYKRPGMYEILQVAPGLAMGQGVWNWNGNIISVFGGALYKGSVFQGFVDPAGTYTFSATLGTIPTLFFKSETAAYSYDGTVITPVVDPDYPVTTVRGSAYLDGTTYVLSSTAAEIHGSDLNDTVNWDPLNFILAQIEPDLPIAIAKQMVYVIALKTISTEVFYDAGQAVGSPLGSVQGSKLGVGCRAAGSVRKMGDELMWLGRTTEGDLQVMLMSKVHGDAVSTPAVERLLKILDYSVVWSWNMKISGHRFYVLTMPVSNISLVFDLTSGGWYIWTTAEGNYLPYVDATYTDDGRVWLQHATDGKLYEVNADRYTDAGSIIPVRIFTPSVDGGTRQAKQNSRLEIIADQIDTSVLVAWTDDDYQTFNGSQSISLNQERPYFQDGSSFSHRAYRIEHSDDTFFRIKALEMTAQPGTA